MRSKLGIFFIIIGMVLVIAALSLLCLNYIESEQAENASVQALEQIKDVIEEESLNSTDEEAQYPDFYSDEMKEVQINNESYIGYLTISSLDLQLPVISEWSYENLKKAPCRYSGSTKTDDLVIAAHNYGKHFGRLNALSINDEIVFTDMNGISTLYTVKALDFLTSAAVEEMTAGEYDLSLFTCTYDGKNRVTVRCDRSNK